ncbi:Ig-like domain-containing protein [Litorisediminicola beolgyonensis]|uniref:Ig-like domain-containing protein n=2 Tax=Litorisediminicola beolgyonensis TaxID=1173614 RepID=A0ABW3ZEK6_9RHOB
MGAVQRGKISETGETFAITAQPGSEISVHLNASDVRGYDRVGNDLQMTLADGRVVVLDGYFAPGAEQRLFLSASGQLSEVMLVDGGGGVLLASYAPAEAWGKWTPSESLIFLDEPQVVAATYLDGDAASEEDVSMLATGLLGGSGLLTTLGAGGAAVGGAALLGSAGGDGDGGGSNSSGNGGDERVDPTVNNADGGISLNGEDDEFIAITGTAEGGSEVVVTIGDEQVTVIAKDDDTWEAVFDGENFPEDGTYEVDVVVNEDDGTTSQLDGPTIEIDTIAPELTILSGTGGTGGLLNLAGYEGGQILTGTTEPGATVTITIDGASYTATVSETGSWQFLATTSILEMGTYTREISVISTDAFGNATVIGDTIVVDTDPHPLTIDPVTSDNIVNAAEAGAGILVTGSSTPGAVISFSYGAFTTQVVTGAGGSWSVTVPSSVFEAGEYGATLAVSTVDGAGNASSAQTAFDVDTIVRNFQMLGTPGGADGVVNFAEAAEGLILTGTVEPGSTVMVTLAGVSHAATVSASGSWSVSFAASELPAGETSATLTAVATDRAGNSATLSQSITFDTIAPDAPVIESYTRDHTGLRGISIESTEAEVALGHVEADGSVSEVDFSSADLVALGETALGFTEVVPDGSHLVVTTTDAAGNTAGTYLVVDDTTTSEVAMTDALAQTLSEYEIGVIDLQFAEESQLTITEAQIKALAADGDELTVIGGADDVVTISGAEATGTETVNGETFNTFAFGDAVLKIDDDITQVVI